jgi:glyoxylase-like metal-dependent hydrolase (beta-lactamase superfamily II)
VVDPQPAIEQYLDEAARARMRITHIVKTHVQADHLSGCRELAAKTGAPICLHEEARPAFPVQALKDGDVLDLGNVTAQILHTPGHSPDSICLLVTDKTRSPDPWFVLTGDTLFVGDAGRPDLHGAEAAGRLAGQLYDSLFGRLLTLDDQVEVYPSHFAGSACGRHMSGKPHSTIGFERRFNAALRRRDREEFVRFMLEKLPPQPPEFALNRQRNLGLI